MDLPTASGSGRIVLESPDELKSTMEHRLWVAGTSGLLSLTFINGLAHITDTSDSISAAVALFAAYVMSDFGTGVYHWAVDKYVVVYVLCDLDFDIDS